MQLTRRAAFAAGAATLASGRRRARAQSATIRIGLLTDFSGPFRDINGPTSVACLAQAVAEFTAANPDIKVATISADHQNKPDVAVSILRSWFDESGVDMVLNVTNSAVALAATTIITDKEQGVRATPRPAVRCLPGHPARATWCTGPTTPGTCRIPPPHR